MTVERVSDHHILKGTGETLSVSFYVDGAVVDPGDVTVSITRADGTAVVTAQAASGSGAAARTYTLTPSQTADLDLLTVVWSGTIGGVATSVTTYAEVVGDHLFTLNEARAFEENTLSNTTTYPQAVIEQARARITDAFEDICNVAFIRRYRRIVLDGPGRNCLILPSLFVSSLRSIEYRTIGTTDWTAFTDAELADCFTGDDGLIERETGGAFTRGRQNYRVAYEYGRSRVPSEINRAALKLLVSMAGLVRTNLPERATSLSDETGTFQLATPGMRGSWFGLPEVDSVLSRYARNVPGVG